MYWLGDLIAKGATVHARIGTFDKHAFGPINLDHLSPAPEWLGCLDHLMAEVSKHFN